MLMRGMADGLALRLRGGALSSGLVDNLMRFQERWVDWRPTLKVVDVLAEAGNGEHDGPRGRIAAFSGGLDSSFTLFQHNKAAASGLVPIDAALMVHGFDIPLTDRAGFEKATVKGRRITADAGVPMLHMRTNIRGVPGGKWHDSHGTALAAALAALGGGFSSGVIASTMNRAFPAVWGSNPTTDPLLGSPEFRIDHHGYEIGRLEKFRALSGWTAAIENLRVCWQNEHRDRNCGRCHKCVLTQLTLRCLHLPTTCFEEPLDDRELARHIPRKYPGGLNRYDLLELAAHCAANRINGPWADVLRELYTT
jgi:hypothetical protein